MINRIDTKLTNIKDSGNTALASFITLGFPDLETSKNIAIGLAQSGVDLLELGIPFSDPIADGPIIQKTSLHALKQGVNLKNSLSTIKTLRSKDRETPIVLLGYFNPFLQYGLSRFVKDASNVGVDGLIVPDLPTEESASLRQLCTENNLHLIPLLAPTSTEKRISQACKHANGFIYCVQVAGVTGARDNLHRGIRDLVEKIRRHTELPVLVGFGVSTREHVNKISEFADGSIVGSALLQSIDSSLQGEHVNTAKSFIYGLRGSK